MDIYYYCSYTGSPVGFQLGRLDCETGRLVNENIPLVIRRCFNRGMMQKACGYLPGKNKYFLLVKDLTAKKAADGDADEYYLNIALVFDKFEEYQLRMSEPGDTEQSIADTIRDTMRLRNDPEFGYTVIPEQIAKLKMLSFGGLFRAVRKEPETAYFQVLSSKMSADELRNLLGLPDGGIPLEKFSSEQEKRENWFRLSKKKENQPKVTKKLLGVAALIIIAVILILLIVFSKDLGTSYRALFLSEREVDLDALFIHIRYSSFASAEIYC